MSKTPGRIRIKLLSDAKLLATKQTYKPGQTCNNKLGQVAVNKSAQEKK